MNHTSVACSSQKLPIEAVAGLYPVVAAIFLLGLRFFVYPSMIVYKAGLATMMFLIIQGFAVPSFVALCSFAFDSVAGGCRNGIFFVQMAFLYLTIYPSCCIVTMWMCCNYQPATDDEMDEMEAKQIAKPTIPVCVLVTPFVLAWYPVMVIATIALIFVDFAYPPVYDYFSPHIRAIMLSDIGNVDAISRTLIEFNASPLTCEFYVKYTNDHILIIAQYPEMQIFPNSNNMLLSSSYRSTKYVIAGGTFIGYGSLTCDTENVKYELPLDSSDKIFAEVDVKLAKLTCPVGFKLMFMGEGATQFMEASSIVCERNQNYKYGYRPTLISSSSTNHDIILASFKAHCEATTCKMCDLSMVPSTISDPQLHTYIEGGCTLLKCAKGRMKIDSNYPAEGSAQCRKENNKAVWQFNGETIKKTTVIACVEKLECKVAEAQSLCSNCIMDTTRSPKCLSSQTLTFNGLQVDVFCNHDTGEFIMKDGSTEFPASGKALVCVENATLSGPKPFAQSAASPLNTLTCVFAALFVIAAIVAAVVGYCLYKKKKERKVAPKTDLKTGMESKSVESKSKESNQVVGQGKAAATDGTPTGELPNGLFKNEKGDVVRPANDNETLMDCPTM